MVIQKIKKFFATLLLKEPSPRKLAMAFSMGVYIAISPFVGFHTLMSILASWLFSLNFFVVFTVNAIINNPWTMVPVYATDYVCGEYICTALWGNNLCTYNPSWMNWLNIKIAHYIGLSGISLPAFLIGGNVLAIGCGLLSYPIMRYIFSKLIHVPAR